MASCQKCGAEVAKDARFCRVCGTPVGTPSPPAPEVTQAEVAAASGTFCPYCGAELVPPPKAAKKCPHCGEKIHLRRVAGADERRLMTEAEAAENDKAWERYHTYNRLRRDYGVTDADYDRERAELAAKWGCEPSPADVLWRWANGRSAQLGGQGDWQGLGVLTFTMALQLYEEGRDHFKLSQVARKYELLAMQREEKNQPYKIRVRVLGVCPESRALEGRLYTIEEALEEMPIPRADCTWQTSARGSKSGRGWCACTYTEELQF